jgi:hypothetical protein
MADRRPKRLHTSSSFTRLEATAQPKNPLSRSRASTLQGPPMPAILDPLKPEDDEGYVGGDVFAFKEDEVEHQGHQLNVPEGFEALPIEIRSLTER